MNLNSALLDDLAAVYAEAAVCEVLVRRSPLERNSISGCVAVVAGEFGAQYENATAARFASVAHSAQIRPLEKR